MPNGVRYNQNQNNLCVSGTRREYPYTSPSPYSPSSGPHHRGPDFVYTKEYMKITNEVLEEAAKRSIESENLLGDEDLDLNAALEFSDRLTMTMLFTGRNPLTLESVHKQFMAALDLGYYIGRMAASEQSQTS